jgi:hypothetical protein
MAGFLLGSPNNDFFAVPVFGIFLEVLPGVSLLLPACTLLLFVFPVPNEVKSI